MDTSAFDRAKKLGIPLVFQEADAIIELNPDGSKNILKRIERIKINIPDKFQLK